MLHRPVESAAKAAVSTPWPEMSPSDAIADTRNQVLTVSDRPTAAIQRLPYQYQRTDRRALELSPEVVSIL